MVWASFGGLRVVYYLCTIWGTLRSIFQSENRECQDSNLGLLGGLLCHVAPLLSGSVKKHTFVFLILFLLSSLNYWMTLGLDLVVVSAGSIKNWWNKHFTEMITHQIDKNCSSKSICWKIWRISQRNNIKIIIDGINWWKN